ncbi:MAG: pirin family protein [Bacteroidota bacterium]
MKNSIKKIIPVSWVQMGGHPLRQPLPNNYVENIGPLLLIHHHQSIIKESSKQNEVGVGPHPHTGFAPVTFIYKGNVNHRDSRGNNSVVEAGGIQWMNSGMGIVHSERPSVEFAANGSEQEIIQIWINSPAKFKKNQPEYFAINKEEIKVLSFENLEIKVTVGNYQNLIGFNKAQSDMVILDIVSSGKCKQVFTLNKGWEHAIYNLDKDILVNNETVKGSDLVIIDNDATEIEIEFNEPTRLLFFDMEAINEPIASYGPFVMNTQTEIMEAMRNYQMGKMGILIEE